MGKNNLVRVTTAMVTALVIFGLKTGVSASDTSSKISDVNQKIDQTQSLISDGQKKISKLQEKQTVDAQEIQSLNKNIDARKAHLAKQARSAQLNDTSSVIQFVTDSNSLSDAVDRVTTVATMVHANNQTLSDQKKDKLKVAADKESIDLAATQQKKVNTKLQSDMADLAVQKTELQVKKAKEDADKKKAENALAAAKKAATTVKTTKDSTVAVKALATANKAATDVTNKTENLTNVVAASSSGNKAANVTNLSNNNNNNKTTTSVNNSTNSEANNAASSSSSTSSSVPSSSSVDTGSAVSAALSLTRMGIPYVWGGASLSGMDCSGLTAYVYGKFGVSLPHNTAAQEGYVSYESVSQAQPGDLLFWGSKGSSYHVAIYIGGGQYVHAPQTGQNVKVGSISTFTPSFAGRLK
ncbi:NlpC P60 [Liquorilactobacillus aquaticus DSM 21051]|uniref:NlpC P60 n=1 Tax=Liquorilactobacillus aquaticus DSM 21051 TaxID=1423725 RepID=A0A0R2D6R0_9LACO|nr:NlpC/P60 family protein [Liquorilactobacillus aquaticus]KRM95932.1 NlpC P60 [Liquorilactobacillus aquaticus DSM 21051]